MFRNREAVKERALTKAFNTAAELEQALIALQKANPDFYFVSGKNGNKVTFLTNIPLTGRRAGQHLEITVFEKGDICLNTDTRYPIGSRPKGISTVFTHRVKKAASIVRRHIDNKRPRSINFA